MKAMVIDKFGSVNELHLAEVPTPVAQKDEILVRVAYAGVNAVDWRIREGMLKSHLVCRFPLILGWEVAGTVVALGPAVSRFKVGDVIYSYCRKPVAQWGGYAEFIALKETLAAHAPKNISLAQAAATPMAILTALHGLKDIAGLSAGQTILILAGTSSVGGFAVQYAKAVGAKVIATATTANHPYLTGLGAEVCIDPNVDDLVAIVKKRCDGGVDVVLDCSGGDLLRRSLPALREDGHLIGVVEETKPLVPAGRSLRASFVFPTPNAERLEEIATLLDDGHVKPPLIEEMPFYEVRAAQEKSRVEVLASKVVMHVPDEISEEAAQRHDKRASAQPKASGAAGGQTKTILVIDDDISNCQALRIFLEKTGYKVLTNTDAYAGIALAINSKPNLILLDMEVPSGTGAKIFEKLRQNVFTSTIPIIVMTTMSEADAVKQLPPSIVTGVVFQRSSDMEALLKSVVQLIGA